MNLNKNLGSGNTSSVAQIFTFHMVKNSAASEGKGKGRLGGGGILKVEMCFLESFSMNL